MKSKQIKTLCIVLLIASIAVLLFSVGKLLSLNSDVLLPRLSGYDAKWMEGKTLEEIVTRYGYMDMVGSPDIPGGRCGYRIGDGIFVKVLELHFDTSSVQPKEIATLRYNPKAVVKSTSIEPYPNNFFEHEVFWWYDYKRIDPHRNMAAAEFYCNWAVGKDLATFISLAGEPDYYATDPLEVYYFKQSAKMTLDESFTIVSTEYRSYFEPPLRSDTVPWDREFLPKEQWEVAFPKQTVSYAIPIGVAILSGGVVTLLVVRSKKKKKTAAS